MSPKIHLASQAEPPSGNNLALETFDKSGTAEIAQLERVVSTGSELQKDHPDFERVDKELAQYAARGRITLDDETHRRLKRLIDRRVLAVMIFTYFLQALDKGTLSFTSIMHIQQDTHLVGQQVRRKSPIWNYLPLADYKLVFLVDHVYLHCYSSC